MDTIVLTYIGRRRTTDGKFGHFWLEDGPGDVQRGYGKLFVPALIGERWRFTVNPEGKLLLQEPKERLDMVQDADKLAEWTGEDIWTAKRESDRLTEQRLKKRPEELEKLIAPLRQFIHATKRHDLRASLIEHVVRELWRKA